MSLHKDIAGCFALPIIICFALVACGGEAMVPESAQAEKVENSDNLSEFPEGEVAAEENEWNNAIKKVEALRESFSKSRSEFEWVGTIWNEIHVPEHSCSILGRMLGKRLVVSSIEINYDERNIGGYDGEPGVSDYDLGVTINSLDNWLINAERLLAASQAERIREWNLDCVGQMGIPTAHMVEEVISQTFYTLENDGTVLRIFGDVEQGFAAKLKAALDRSPSAQIVALGSAGGRVYEAIAAGEEIRRRELGTVLWNECLSACTLVFLGGVDRRIWSPYPRLGFHRVSNAGEAVSLNSQVYQDIGIYSARMGVSPRHVLSAMAVAMPDDMHYPDSDYLCAGSIITWMQRAHLEC